MLDTVQWTEKYRPKELKDVALSPDNRVLLETYIEKGEIPHLLLIGPAGCGKTTVAKILARVLDCRPKTLNASMDRGIDVVRNDIGGFIRGLYGAKINLVILDEADAMTPDAQTALRNVMETYAEYGRFVLTANYAYKIIDPIQSRCQILQMGSPPVETRYEVLSRVLDGEGVEATKEARLAFVNAFTDMRRLLYEAQRSILTTGGGLGPPDRGEATGPAVWTLVSDGGYKQLVRIAKDPTVDFGRLLTDLFWAIPSASPRPASCRVIVARGASSLARSPDAPVHFLGVCAELMEALSDG